ncbi:MAG: hypothetical protein IT220_01145 [Flavobacteriaceae bacterium]|nr:hypothetical protein [Flavobacteriaceae bacterium]
MKILYYLLIFGLFLNCKTLHKEILEIDPIEPITADFSRVKELQIFFKAEEYAFETSGYCFIDLLVNDSLKVESYRIKKVKLHLVNNEQKNLLIVNEKEIDSMQIDFFSLNNYLNLIKFSRRVEPICKYYKLRIAIPISKNYTD